MHSQTEIAWGHVSLDHDTIQVSFAETATPFTLASQDMSVATVSNSNDGSCIVNAVNAGVTIITVSVETEQGNIYTARVEITVD